MATKKNIKAVAKFARGTAPFTTPAVGANQAITGATNGTVNVGVGGEKRLGQPEVNTTAVQAGNGSIVPDTANPAQNSQAGGNGNATTNPYSNAFQTYKTNLEKVKNEKTGQLDTEYNRQQEQINSAASGLNRNAYVTYMQRQIQNRNTASNRGASRTGYAENMQTANAVDYNRSLGNIGAYRTNQLSNAENAYNSNRANIDAQFDTDLMNAENEYAQLDIGRQNELADLQQQQQWQANENALDRQQQAKEADRAYQMQVKQFNQQKYETKFNNWYNTLDQYTNKKSVDKAIKKLRNAKKNGTLKPWQSEYYSSLMSSLRTKRNTLKK